MQISNALGSLVDCIRSSERILVIVGAGLSRPSGVPTFREDPDFWARPVEGVATKSAFIADPIAVWAVYERLRKIARLSLPNAGHMALAMLAEAKSGSLTISQNIDDLSQAAGHNSQRLVCLHGSVFDIACSNELCNFTDRNERELPTVPGLLIDRWDSRDTRLSLPNPTSHSVPQCPKCGSGILRPGVVWFGEKLPRRALDRIDLWLSEFQKVDLALVVGTERAPFLSEAQDYGARAAFFNIFDHSMESSVDIDEGHWFVDGDASHTLPYIIGLALGGVVSERETQYGILPNEIRREAEQE